VLEHLGRDESRRDRVDGYPDAVLLELPRPRELERRLASECLGQPEQPRFRGCVVRLPDVADLADDRGDVDDPSRPFSIMCGNTAWDMKNAPERLTAITLYQSSSVILSTVLSIVIPALLTRMSSFPCSWTTSLMVRRQSSVRTDITLVDARVNAVAAQLGEQLAGALSVLAVAGGDDRALLSEAAADRRSDTPRAAGHERDASVHSSPAVVGREGLGSGRWVTNSHGAHRLSPRSCLSGVRALRQRVVLDVPHGRRRG
jgi:hypothetical protein